MAPSLSDHADAQDVADVVEAVDRQALPEEEVPDGLQPGEAARAAAAVGGVAGRRAVDRAARVVVDRAAAVVERLEELAQRLGGGGRLARERAQLLDLVRALLERARAHLGGLAERAHRGPRGLGERAEQGEERVEVGRGARGRREQRDLLVGQVLEARHRGRQLVEEAGQLVEGLAQLLAPGGGDLGGLARLDDEARHLLLARLELGRRPCRSRDEVLDHRVLVAEDLQHLAGLAQARVGALEHLLEVLGPAGEAGAELVDDQPQALAVGAAQDVVDQVLRDRGLGLLDRDRAAVLELLLDVPGWQST